MISWTAQVLDCCPVAPTVALSTHLISAMDTRSRDTLADVCAASAETWAAAHRAGHAVDHPDGSPDFPQWSWVARNTFAQALATRWAATPDPGPLNDSISAAVAAGLDGELLCWSIINRESGRHEGLIHKECNRLTRVLPHRSAEELKGYGWAGLRVALRNFDPALGYAFSTYACPKINGAIRDGVRAESPIPKRLTTFVRKVSAAEESLVQALGRPPTYLEIAAYLDASLESMHLLTRLTNTASLEEMSNPWGDATREPACLVDAADPAASAVTALRNEALLAAVDSLPADEADAVRLLLLQDMPVTAAAAALGIEPRSLRALKTRALARLEPLMRDWVDAPLTV